LLLQAVSPSPTDQASVYLEQLARSDWPAFLRMATSSLGGLDVDSMSMSDLLDYCTQEDWLIRTTSLENFDVSHLWASVKAPTLIRLTTGGPFDWQDKGREVAARLPNAELVVLGFKQMLERPEELAAQSQEFLNRHALALKPLPQDRLSARELEVLRLLAAGRSNQQLADELVISLNTVRRHVSNIFAKTGAANRADAVSYAHRHGLINNS
jgi:DNA-binding CsgD family transcriptional regulator